MNDYLQAHQIELDKIKDFFRKDITNLRTGRANPALLDNVTVEAYGSRSPLNAVGNITVSDGQSLIITPWDKSVLKDLEKAVVAADLGVGVVNEGERLRLTVPALTEENRRELVKKLHVKLEEANVSLRHWREDIKKAIENDFAAKLLGEDDKFRWLKNLDKAVNDEQEVLKAMKDSKEKDIMTI